MLRGEGDAHHFGGIDVVVGEDAGGDAAAVLPLAMTVQVCQEVLAENGFDPNLVVLAAEDPDDRIAAKLAVHPVVRLIDFTTMKPSVYRCPVLKQL